MDSSKDFLTKEKKEFSQKLSTLTNNLKLMYKEDAYLSGAVDNKMVSIKSKGSFIADKAMDFLTGNESLCLLSIPWINGYTQNCDRSENVIASFEMGSTENLDFKQEFKGLSVSYFDCIEFSFLDSKFNAYDFCCNSQEIIFMLCFKPFL